MIKRMEEQTIFARVATRIAMFFCFKLKAKLKLDLFLVEVKKPGKGIGVLLHIGDQSFNSNNSSTDGTNEANEHDKGEKNALKERGLADLPVEETGEDETGETDRKTRDERHDV